MRKFELEILAGLCRSAGRLEDYKELPLACTMSYNGLILGIQGLLY